MASPETWPNPVTTRSQVMLAIALDLVANDNDVSLRQAKVQLKEQGRGDWNLTLFGSGSFDGVDAVAKREADLAIINPANGLMMAYTGIGPYTTPQPVRQISVIPSLDQFLLTVRPELGLAALEDIPKKKPRLVFALRGQREHCMNIILEDVFAAAGFSFEDISRWGGEVRYEAVLPWPDTPKFRDAVEGRTNALIDEGADAWGNQAIDSGMVVLTMAEETVQQARGAGLSPRRAADERFPQARAGRAVRRLLGLADHLPSRARRRQGAAHLRRARGQRAFDRMAGRRAASGSAHVPRGR